MKVDEKRRFIYGMILFIGIVGYVFFFVNMILAIIILLVLLLLLIFSAKKGYIVWTRS